MEIIGGLRANTTAGTTRKVLALLDSPSRGSDAGTRCVLDAPAGTGALAQLLKQRGHSVVLAEVGKWQYCNKMPVEQRVRCHRRFCLPPEIKP